MKRQRSCLSRKFRLTPQMVERFKGRFGDAVAVMHSRLSNGERYDEWRKIREAEHRSPLAPDQRFLPRLNGSDSSLSMKSMNLPTSRRKHRNIMRGM